MTAISRTCRDCDRPFDISPEEQQFFRQLAAEQTHHDWSLPRRCPSCRAERRRRRRVVVVDDGRDERRVCSACGAAFVFGAEDRRHFAARGWCAPERCQACRRTRPAAARLPQARRSSAVPT